MLHIDVIDTTHMLYKLINKISDWQNIQQAVKLCSQGAALYLVTVAVRSSRLAAPKDPADHSGNNSKLRIPERKDVLRPRKDIRESRQGWRR